MPTIKRNYEHEIQRGAHCARAAIVEVLHGILEPLMSGMHGVVIALAGW